MLSGAHEYGTYDSSVRCQVCFCLGQPCPCAVFATCRGKALTSCVWRVQKNVLMEESAGLGRGHNGHVGTRHIILKLYISTYTLTHLNRVPLVDCPESGLK